uniref:Uncharacterized protein n=1 Tax=Anguilla anguilla TaxID=7936 RepID=A0A0E9QK32_ANGAN
MTVLSPLGHRGRLS